MEKAKKQFDSPAANCIWATYFLITLALPIAMIVIGSMYLYQCPVQRYIPIYLIVGGTFSLYIILVGLLTSFRQFLKGPPAEGEQSETTTTQKCGGILYCLVSAFMFCWFIAGNVWVYSLHISGSFDTKDPEADNYCHPTLFWFAFWAITASYIMIAALVLIYCCNLCCLPLCITGCSKIRAEI